ncbi:TolC family protein [Thiomicrorhabdus sp.]|uniref:TolC family protein n=1 Tax=Thiomicrorhabdus sp. TaxID=2039724 RepID=UPI0029C78E53|nr:TolC family protein [Thiomicrorhabdus sp.]
MQSAESRYRESVQTYHKSVLTALLEVEQALGNVHAYKLQELSQQAALKEAERSLLLAELRYTEGADELSTVLDAQRTLFQAKESAVQIRQLRLDAMASLYKVLGGGWKPS